MRDIACGVLVPGPGIEPEPPALETRDLHHWTFTREVPHDVTWCSPNLMAQMAKKLPAMREM